jgi:hypothetical protein
MNLEFGFNKEGRTRSLMLNEVTYHFIFIFCIEDSNIERDHMLISLNLSVFSCFYFSAVVVGSLSRLMLLFSLPAIFRCRFYLFLSHFNEINRGWWMSVFVMSM